GRINIFASLFVRLPPPKGGYVFTVVGTARCAVRAAYSGATSAEVRSSCALRSARCTRAGTSQHDVPTGLTKHVQRGWQWRANKRINAAAAARITGPGQTASSVFCSLESKPVHNLFRDDVGFMPCRARNAGTEPTHGYGACPVPVVRRFYL